MLWVNLNFLMALQGWYALETFCVETINARKMFVYDFLLGLQRRKELSLLNIVVVVVIMVKSYL
jgi:hypothetical protein